MIAIPTKCAHGRFVGWKCFALPGERLPEIERCVECEAEQGYETTALEDVGADGRCCGDHPGAWDTPAEPGHGFCAACLRELSEP